MAEFVPAWEELLKEEGGLVDHPNDPGGITNFGISLRWALQTDDRDRDGFQDADINRDGKVNADDIRQLTKARTASLYRAYWWDEYRYGQIEDQALASRVFSMSVNMGASRAHKLLQRAVGACAPRITVDGLLGPKSRSAIACCHPGALLAALKAEQAGFYRLLAATKPRFKPFLQGWLNRAYA